MKFLIFLSFLLLPLSFTACAFKQKERRAPPIPVAPIQKPVIEMRYNGGQCPAFRLLQDEATVFGFCSEKLPRIGYLLLI